MSDLSTTATAPTPSDNSAPDDPLDNLWNAFTGVGEYAAIHAALLREAVIHALAARHDEQTGKAAGANSLPSEQGPILLPPATAPPTISPAQPAAIYPSRASAILSPAAAPASNALPSAPVSIPHPLDVMTTGSLRPDGPARFGGAAKQGGLAPTPSSKLYTAVNYDPDLNLILQEQDVARHALGITARATASQGRPPLVRFAQEIDPNEEVKSDGTPEDDDVAGALRDDEYAEALAKLKERGMAPPSSIRDPNAHRTQDEIDEINDLLAGRPNEGVDVDKPHLQAEEAVSPKSGFGNLADNFHSIETIGDTIRSYEEQGKDFNPSEAGANLAKEMEDMLKIGRGARIAFNGRPIDIVRSENGLLYDANGNPIDPKDFYQQNDDTNKVEFYTPTPLDKIFPPTTLQSSRPIFEGPSTQPPTASTPPSALTNPDGSPFDKKVANGYAYHIDSLGRPGLVEADLSLNLEQLRNLKAQIAAGVPDRLGDDDGGHFIARIFNGPTDDFNHFAQNSNFNRGAYRTMERGWRQALENGQTVNVKIVPTYEGTSLRPSTIEIIETINGRVFEYEFINRYGGR